MSALRELIATFFVEADTHELEKADEKVESFVGKLKEVAEVLAGAFAVEKIHEFVESQVAVATGLERTSIRLGTTTTELQALNLAAAESGVGADALANSMRFLNLHLAEASKGGGQAAALFKEAGVAIKDTSGKVRPAGDVLADLADHIASIDDPAKQTQLAMRLLGRGGAELIPLLKGGGAAFEEARKKVVELGGGIDEGFIKQAKQAEEQTADLTFATQGLKTQIAGALLPVALKVVTWLKDVTVKAIEFTKHTNVLSTALIFFGTIASVKALHSLIGLAKEFGLIKPSILGTVRALLGFALPLVFVGLLYLAFDELYNLLKGNKTLIGDALGPDKEAFVAKLRGAVDSLTAAFGGLTGAVGGENTTAMGFFGDVVVGVAKDVAGLVEVISALVQALGWVVEKADTAARAVGHFLGITTDTEKAQFGGDAANAGLTEEARKRLADIGVKPGEATPYSALGRPQTQLTGARDPLARTVPGAWAPGGEAFGTREAFGVREPHLPIPAGAQGGGKGKTEINQHIDTKVELTLNGTGSTEKDAKRIGDATGAGPATAVQLANDRARTAGKLP